MSTDQNHRKSISVIIPLYNHERYIDAAIDSLLAQSVPPAEIIIVDDGSQDGSWRKVQQRAETEARIIAWSRPNRGAHATINEAIARATGEYLTILNSDDRYHPERLATCLDTLEQCPEADAVFTALSFIDGAGNAQRNKWYEQAIAFYRRIGDLSLALVNGNIFMTTSNLFVRRRVFAEVGLFANLRYAHDLDFFLRLTARERRVVWLEQPLLHYRMHDTNTISEDALKVKAEWAAAVACFAWRLGQGRDWTYLARLVEIAERHNLTRLLFFFFLEFQRLNLTEVSLDSCLDDADFVRFMNEAVA